MIQPSDRAVSKLNRAQSRRWQDRRPPLTQQEFSATLMIPDTEDDVTGQPLPNDPTTHAPTYYGLKLVDGEITRPGDGGRYRSFVWVADTQDAKSWIIQQIMGHTVVERGMATGYGLPTKDKWGELYETKLRPAFIESGLQPYMPTVGAGARGGSSFKPIRLRVVNGKGGGVLVPMTSGGRNESGQAMLTLRDLIVDEYDDWTATAANKIKRRLDRFMSEGRARLHRASTVKKNKKRNYSLILREYEKTCRARIEYQCPSCRKHTLLEWDQFTYDTVEDVADGEAVLRVVEGSAAVKCMQCQHPITDAEREDVLLNGHRLSIRDPKAEDCGLWWSALECPWKTLDWLASLDLDANRDLEIGIPETIEDFTHDQKAERYQGETAVKNVSRHNLALRSAASEYNRGQLFDDVAKVVTAIDIQLDRCYWLALGGANDGRRWVIDWGEEYWSRRDQEPTDEMRWAVLDEVLARARDGWAYPSGELRSADLVCADVNYESKSIMRWIAGKSKVVAIRGDHTEGRTLNGRTQERRRSNELKSQLLREYVAGRLQLRELTKPPTDYPRREYVVRTIAEREVMRSGWSRELGQPGAWHLPRGVAVDDYLTRHLTAWQLEPDEQGNDQWVKHGRRDDWHDDCAYADVLLARMFEGERSRAKRPKRKYGLTKRGA